MNLFETILAARNNNLDKFLPLLIVAFVIAVNIIKAIARGIKSMSQQNSPGNESGGQKRPSGYLNANNSYKTLEQMRDEKIAQIRTTFGIPSPPPQEEFEELEEEYVAPTPPPVPQKKYIQKPQPRRAPSNPQADIHFTEMLKDVGINPTISDSQMAPLSKHYAQQPQKAVEHKHLRHSDSSKPQPLLLINAIFSSPDDLRKAVLYQEILSKPLALRE